MNYTISDITKMRKSKNLDGLVQVILDDNQSANVRNEAARTVGRLSTPESLKTLTCLYSHEDVQIRVYALRGLAQIRDEKVIRFYTRALMEPNVDVAVRYEARQKLYQIMKDRDHPACSNAVRVLSRNADSRTVDLLLPLLRHEDRVIRASAVHAFEYILAPVAVGLLLELARDRDYEIEVLACSALDRYFEGDELPGDKTLIPSRTRLYKLFNTDDEAMRLSAALCLGYMYDDIAGNYLTKLLYHPVESIRYYAVLCLTKLETWEAVDDIVNLISSEESEYITKKAVEALCAIGTEKAVLKLIDIMNSDTRIDVRNCAKFQLHKIAAGARRHANIAMDVLRSGTETASKDTES